MRAWKRPGGISEMRIDGRRCEESRILSCWEEAVGVASVAVSYVGAAVSFLGACQCALTARSVMAHFNVVDVAASLGGGGGSCSSFLL